MILFLACDTQARHLECGIYCDLCKVRREAERISSYTDLPIKEISFVGGELYPQSVFDALALLEVEADDLLIFYFSGHGFRTPSKLDNPWPNLFFTAARRGIDYSEVLALLSAKQPRLMIAIADCCNNVMEEANAPPVYRERRSAKKEAQIAVAYQKLFLDCEGEILMTSSVMGEFSWSTWTGAIFTSALLDCLREEVKSGAGDWERILERTAAKVEKYQHPYYEISPRLSGLIQSEP